MGWTANTATPAVTIPAGTPLGHVRDRRPGHEPGPDGDGDRRRSTVVEDDPTAAADRRASVQLGVEDGLDAVTGRRRVAGRDRPVERDRRLRGRRRSVNGGAVGRDDPATAPQTRRDRARSASCASYGSGCGPSTRPGNWSPWAVGRGADPRLTPSTTAARRSADRGAGRELDARARTRRPSTGSIAARGSTRGLTFTGHGIAVVAPRGPHRGSVDGLHRRRLHQDDRPCGRHDRRQSPGRLHARRSPTAARTPIALRVAGSGPHPLVALDAFVVVRSSRRRDGRRLRECAIVTVPTSPGRVTRGRPADTQRSDHGACDVEGGHPVRTGHHPGQALSRDRVQGHQLQHAPQGGPVADPDEGLVPGRG